MSANGQPVTRESGFKGQGAGAGLSLGRVALWALCLALAWVGETAQGQSVDPGNPARRVAQSGYSATSNDPAEDLLQFLDGATMHGTLQGMDPARGLRWLHRDANKPFVLQPSHLDFLRFPHAQPVTNSPTCYFRFVSGDELFGTLVSMNGENLELNTWFGSTLKIPRAAVQTISFLPKSYAVVYEGPSDASDWVMGGQEGQQTQQFVVQGGGGIPMNVIIANGARLFINGVTYANGGGPNRNTNWTWRDGTFVSTGPGTLGRDFHLHGSSTIDFDVVCAGNFNLLMQLYTSSLDRMDFNNGSFMIDFDDNPNAIARGPSSGIPNDLGNVLLPSLYKLGHAHITIHCNQEDRSITVLVDGEVAKRWNDAGFSLSPGGGIFFQSQSMETMQLSHFKVSHWEGGIEPDLAPASLTNVDAVSFINQDKAGGKIAGVEAGKLRMTVAGNSLAIPLERVRQIDFAEVALASPPTRGPWDVRAEFAGGGSVSFTLEKWDRAVVAGRSPLFGPLLFPSESIREMTFNLDRPRTAPAAAMEDEFDALDR